MDYLDSTLQRGSPVRPSPIFLLVIAATGVGAWLCVARPVNDGISVFTFVLSGWILSLILHEFAHAYTAWHGGDTSVAARGYLTLDPRRYTSPMTSLFLPLLVLVIGGIGLPGGAVWINRGALRSPATATMVSLAGPATNLVLGVVCLVSLSAGLIDVVTQPVLASAVAFLGFLQIIAFVLNMLPVPGLDGFGALEPHLPQSLQQALAPLRTWGLLILIGLLFYVQPVSDLFWDTIVGIMDGFEVDRRLTALGWELFRFWE